MPPRSSQQIKNGSKKINHGNCFLWVCGEDGAVGWVTRRRAITVPPPEVVGDLVWGAWISAG